MADPFGVMLISGTHDRVHMAFMVAAAAAALGRDVTLFASNAGCRGLLTDWGSLRDAERDIAVQARGVPGLDILRQATVELAVRMIACETGLRAEAIDPAALLPGVQVAGLATFLSAVAAGQIVTC